MFLHKLRVQKIAAQEQPMTQGQPTECPVPVQDCLHVQDCPIHWIDNFAMRNFTNEPIFDDTLPSADGLLEAGQRVPLARLRPAMEDWFRRKSYLKPDEQLEVLEIED